MLNMAPEAIRKPQNHPQNALHQQKLRLEKQLAEFDVCVSRQRDECQLFSSAMQFDTSVVLIETAGRHYKKRK